MDENCDGIIEVTSSSEPEPEPEQKNTNEFIIYPNPASENLYIVKPHSHDFKIEIFDVNQRQVLSERNRSTFDIARLSNGIYFLVYSDLVTGKRTVKKWVVSK